MLRGVDVTLRAYDGGRGVVLRKPTTGEERNLTQREGTKMVNF